MSRCRMASFSLKWVHGRGVAYRRCTLEKQRVDKNNILRPLSCNNMRSVLGQGLKILLISAEKKSPVINLRWQLPKSWAWVRSNICPKRDSYGRGKSLLNALDLVSTNKVWGAMAWRSSYSSRRNNNNSILHIDWCPLNPSLSIWIHQNPFILWLCLKLLALLLPISDIYISAPCSWPPHSRLI